MEIDEQMDKVIDLARRISETEDSAVALRAQLRELLTGVKAEPAKEKDLVLKPLGRNTHFTPTSLEVDLWNLLRMTEALEFDEIFKRAQAREPSVTVSDVRLGLYWLEATRSILYELKDGDDFWRRNEPTTEPGRTRRVAAAIEKTAYRVEAQFKGADDTILHLDMGALSHQLGKLVGALELEEAVALLVGYRKIVPYGRGSGGLWLAPAPFDAGRADHQRVNLTVFEKSVWDALPERASVKYGYSVAKISVSLPGRLPVQEQVKGLLLFLLGAGLADVVERKGVQCWTKRFPPHPFKGRSFLYRPGLDGMALAESVHCALVQTAAETREPPTVHEVRARVPALRLDQVKTGLEYLALHRRATVAKLLHEEPLWVSTI